MRLAAGFGILGLLGLALASESLAATSNLKADEEIVFFPGFGWRAPGERGWQIEVRGCVYEPEQRRAALGLLRQALDLKGVELSDAQQRTLAERARLFMADNQRGKRIVVRIGTHDFDLGRSGPDGRFARTLNVPDSVAVGAGQTSMSFSAVLRPRDQRTFAGEAILVPDSGLVVVSDIDDTIKATQVSDPKAMLRRTFLEPFQPVPGMAELYRHWAADRNARFCYLSGSPWQLLAPLSDFRRDNGFPPGAFYLRPFRLKDRTAFDLLKGPSAHKSEVLELLIERFPNHRFVLVGDSGEEDPEIYARLAKRHPGQVEAILIRDVTGENLQAQRYQTILRDYSPDRFRVFRQPAEVAGEEPWLRKP